MQKKNTICQSIEMSVHPDALYDLPYERTHLDLSSYKALQGSFEIKQGRSMAATLQNSDAAVMRIESWGPKTIRIRFSPDNSALYPSVTEQLGLIEKNVESNSCLSDDSAEKYTFEHPSFKYTFDKLTGNFAVCDKDGLNLLQSIEGVRFSKLKPAYSGHRSFMSFNLSNEDIFGFGGRIARPNRTGASADLFSQKVGKRSGDYGGAPIPFFLSTKGYGFFLNNPWPHVYFDMGKTRKNKWFVHAPGGELDIFVFYGPEFKDILESYTKITGRIPAVKKKMLGFWCSSLTVGTTDEALEIAQRLKGDGYPCDGIILDGPWRGGHNFLKQYSHGGEYPSNDMDWHRDFGNGPKMIESLQKSGFETSLHLNSRNFHPETAEKGLANNFLRRNGDEVVPQFFNGQAENFYEKLIAPRIKEGIFLWWTDHADRVSGEIKKGLPSRNLFGALWNRALLKIMAKFGKENHLSLTRGSCIGGQRYAFQWPGDTRVGIDAFEEDIWYCLNAGLAGYPVTSVDASGFTLSKDRDDYSDESEKYAETFSEDNICRRLCQSLFFIPIPRIHNNWDTAPRLPWNCPDTMQKLYKDMLIERYKLTPYIFSYALAASKTGEPILRPLVYHYRNDSQVYDIGDEFLMGDWLLVAPIVKEKSLSRKVYLPKGKWISLWTDEIFEGPAHIDINAPMYEVAGLPVFVKAGAIIAREPFAFSLDDNIPKELTLDIYPNGHTVMKLNESDTITNTFSCSENSDRIDLKIENMTDISRLYTLRVHHISENSKVLIEGKENQEKEVERNDNGCILILRHDIAPHTTAGITIVKQVTQTDRLK